MRKQIYILILILFSIFTINCGYTTNSALPGGLRTIYVESFKNSINYTTEEVRNTYYPLLEEDIKNAVIDRFLFDGNLKIDKAETAALYLKGELVGYEKEPLRYTDDDDVEEYRVQIVVNMVLMNMRTGLPFWEEDGFTGESTYFVTGLSATTEESAVAAAIKDLAKRIVARTIENW